jgi:hypothetical protein
MARFRSLKQVRNNNGPPVSISEDQYPYFYVNEDDFPEIKKWKVGEEYEFEVKLVIESRDTHEKDGRPKEHVTGRVEIRAIKIEKEEDKVLGGYSR